MPSVTFRSGNGALITGALRERAADEKSAIWLGVANVTLFIRFGPAAMLKFVLQSRS